MENVQPKNPVKSKTMMVNAAIILALALIPDVQVFFQDMGWSTAWVVGAMAALNMVLRISTKGPVAMRLAVLRQGFRWMTGRKIK